MITYKELNIKAKELEKKTGLQHLYGFDWRKMTESDCIAELMKMYQKLFENK